MPGKPELSAIKRSSASASLTSPTIILLGRIRSDSLINLLSDISPSPSKFAVLVCRAIQSGNLGFNSNTSSIVITLSLTGIRLSNALRKVVLPACVPPLTNMFKPLATAWFKVSKISSFIEPIFTKSSSELPRLICFLMFTAQCVAVTSGIATCNLLPSGRRASTNGLLTSSRRPPQMSNLSIRS